MNSGLKMGRTLGRILTGRREEEGHPRGRKRISSGVELGGLREW